MGAERVLFGSDFPHPEGCREPRDFVAALEGLSDHEIRLVMRDNFESLLAS
jgi:predicted TIM-barrel fold metal-dependent hydrolase